MFADVRGAVLVTSCTLTGCSLAGAPSFELFGAFFPAWMLCALIGIIGSAGTRAVLTTPTLSGVIPFQLAVCTAVGVIVGLVVWMVLFR
jgi:YtcA family